MLGLGLGLNRGSGGAMGETPFVTTWKTDNLSSGSSTDTQVKLPLISTGTYNFLVDWGDTNQDTITVWNQAETTHTYSSAGTYTITITGICEGFKFNNAGDILKLLTVESWGQKFKLSANGGQFFGCGNLVINAVDYLKLGTTTDLSQAFRVCTNLTTETIKFNNTSNVTTMWAMFYGCTSFNGSLEYLKTDNCLYLSDMFGNCASFNKSVNHFDTSNVTSMQGMFYGCVLYNQPISNFDTSSLVNCSSMFNGCLAFNQSVSSIDTKNCTDLYAMFFNNYVFNQSVSHFDTSNVTNMTYMFSGCRQFNQSVSNFDTSLVTAMVGMFSGCYVFNQSVSNFDTSLVSDFYALFNNCRAFNQDVSNFDSSLVTNMQYLFNSCYVFNQDISGWDFSNVTNMINMLSSATAWSTANYDAFLISADGQTVQSGVQFDCSSYYTGGGSAETARTNLITGDSWTINDLGVAA